MERFGRLAGQLARFGNLRRDDFGGRQRGAGEDAAVVDVLRRIPEPHFAAASAHQDHRELGLEPHQAFVDEARVGHAQPVGFAR